MLRPTFKKRERDRINFPRIDPYYPSRYPSNVVNHNQQPQQTQSYQYRDVGYQTYNYRNNYPRPPGPSRDSSREQLRPVLKPAQTTFTPKVETTNKVTLLPTKKSPPPVSSSSGSEDDDLFDQDEIEEQIDRIDNEIAKQERLLALQRAKSSEVDKDPLKVAKRIPRVYNYELKIGVVEPLEKLEAKPHGNSFDPESLIETIYKENRELIKKLNTVHNRNSMNYFNLVNDGVKQFPKFDVKLFQNIEKVDPKLRPAIVSFIKSRIAATNYEQKKLGLYYKSLDEKWRVKVEVREKQLLNSQKKDVKIKEQKIVEPPKDEIFHENLLPEGRSSRRGGIRTDVVRSEAEWQNALSLLGVSSTSLASNPPAPTPPPFKATGIAKDIPLLSKYEIERLQKFTNNNDLVLDAAAELEQFNSKIQQFWTEYDRNLFRQKLAIYGKDFHKISQFLDNKSTQDCVSYYYREKISGRFKSLIKRASGRGRKRKEFEELGESVGFTTYYLQSDEEFVHGNEADDESTSERNDSETELDLLESAQSIDLPDWTPEEKQRATRGFELFGRDFESVASIVASKNAAQCKLFFNHQRRQSREPMLSGEKKKKKRARKRTDDDLVRKQTPKDEDPNASNPNTTTSTNKRSISYWTVSERQEFLKELEIHGRDWEKIATAIPSKSGIQIRNFFHNSRKKMNLDAILERRGIEY